ncbi:hypothetical protein [Bacillus sp. Brlt_9]|uniref:hypothetical protein n=1 Tax=Bacillus sp. Brlt_9 TaxID=3110916 RepID=UPI003F7B79F4
MDKLQPVLEEIAKHNGDFSVIFFLDINEYGYAFAYESENDKVSTMMLEDRFTKREITSENLDNMIGEENREAVIGSYDENSSALLGILEFWSGGRIGKIDRTLNRIQAVEIGRKEKLDFIVF